MPGDYNANNVVDAGDYVLWRKYLGQSVTLPNDSTPGTVIQADYDVWRAHFGQTPSGSGSGSLLQTAVPEPATLSLMRLLSAAADSLRCFATIDRDFGYASANNARVPSCYASGSKRHFCSSLIRHSYIEHELHSAFTCSRLPGESANEVVSTFAAGRVQSAAATRCFLAGINRCYCFSCVLVNQCKAQLVQPTDGQHAHPKTSIRWLRPATSNSIPNGTRLDSLL